MTSAKKRHTQTPATEVAPPTTLAGLFDRVQHHSSLGRDEAAELVQAIRLVFERHEGLWRQSKQDALQAMSVGFADRMRRMREELAARETTVTSITSYFEALVADLTDRADRDPKTRLMNFQRFIERLDAFLALEQRGDWCAVGLVDIRSFKTYNDAFGHALGDRVIDRVARLLREQVRANDVLAQEAVGERRELHARFGGDEFCFLIPQLDSPQDGWVIAERFRDAVERFDWTIEDERLTARQVAVDVGVVCLLLGPVETRRTIAGPLAQDLLACADRAMYTAKADRVARVHGVTVQITGGTLTPIDLP